MTAPTTNKHNIFADTLPDTLSPSILLERYRKQRHGWIEMGTTVIYRSANFVFRRNLIITELDDCLIYSVKPSQLYGVKRKQVRIFADVLLDHLCTESAAQFSIIIISNQISSCKRNRGAIRLKLQPIIDAGLSMLCIFPTRPNRFMKPMTGAWELLIKLYVKEPAVIRSGIVVSNEGGLIVTVPSKDGSHDTVVSTDVDRAFAANCTLKFRSIDEFLTNAAQQQRFAWDARLISPSRRQAYITLSKAATRIDVLRALLQAFGKRYTYMIMIMGAPRCGKSRLAVSLKSQWPTVSDLQHTAVSIVSASTFSKTRVAVKRLAAKRFSIIVDGWCNSIAEREPYIKVAQRHRMPILCVNVMCGFEMAKIFNYTAVQEATTPDIILHKSRLYDEYTARAIEPTETEMLKYLIYTPEIIESRAVCVYRY